MKYSIAIESIAAAESESAAVVLFDCSADYYNSCWSVAYHCSCVDCLTNGDLSFDVQSSDDLLFDDLLFDDLLFDDLSADDHSNGYYLNYSNLDYSHSHHSNH